VKNTFGISLYSKEYSPDCCVVVFPTFGNETERMEFIVQEPTRNGGHCAASIARCRDIKCNAGNYILMSTASPSTVKDVWLWRLGSK
jgi:hypothetical protein